MTSYTDSVRRVKGFLSVSNLLNTIAPKNHIFDMNSILISESVKIGKSNIFYPNVVIESSSDFKIKIGDNNTFYPGTYIFSSTGDIRIGNNNEFGIGGCILKANSENSQITIGNGGRYNDGPIIMGKTNLGNGCQVLGRITVLNCVLENGGSYQEQDPNKRGAVLKGFGIVRGVVLKTGQVINGQGDFANSPIEWQINYHTQAKM